MTKVYPAIIHEEEGYWVEFPDLSGCFTNGSTLEETMEMAREALGLYLVSLTENNQPIPAPSSIADISVDNGQKTYISTDMNAYRRDTKAVKKMLSIPAWLAKEAEEHNVSLSKVLQDALKEKLNLA
jgi:predicted RNase H-like HicB family nuclease